MTTQKPVLTIGTRSSPLAMAQTLEVQALLMAAHNLPKEAIAIDVISVAGDRILDRPLSEIGGKGLFTEEIEDKLADGRIDLAVHSSKDMPTKLPTGLSLSVFLPREDVRDALIAPGMTGLDDLPEGATFGTSSLRRKALLGRVRPDLNIVGLRGNVGTRLAKLERGDAMATLLACAGLNRLGQTAIITQALDVISFPPAPGQGAICIESRDDDARVNALLAPLNHAETMISLTCERAFLGALDGSCRTPIAAYAVISGDDIHLSGMILTPDGKIFHEIQMDGKVSDAAALGAKAGEAVRAKAGPKFFDSWA